MIYQQGCSRGRALRLDNAHIDFLHEKSHMVARLSKRGRTRSMQADSSMFIIRL